MPDHPTQSPIPHWAGLPLTAPLVMGILNLTPDSFSDGGAHPDPAAAIAHGLAMRAFGAAIIDIGGESTRPGATPVPPNIEAARIIPIIRALAEAGVVVSVDTRNAPTMAAALDAGAAIINDVSALRHDERSAKLLAERGGPVILMHMRGTPATMNCQAHYADLLTEVIDELAARRDAAIAAGIAPAAIALDPGFGFAKIAHQNITLLRGLDRLCALGHPILVGVSRKRFIGDIAQVAEPAARDPASLAAALFAARHGAAILRVHDVAGTVQALRVSQALEPA